MPERLEGRDLVSLMTRLAERREAHILAHWGPHLEAGEKITHWTRARHPGRGRDGFAYLTTGRLVVFWLGQGAFVTDLAGILAWGLSSDAPGGPVFTVETPAGVERTQLPTGSEAGTTQVKGFLEAFARSVAGPPSPVGVGGEEPPSLLDIDAITAEQRSWSRRTRRIVGTIAGVALTVLGFLLAVPLVPGPGVLVAITGVALLASEYDWAKDALHWAKDKARGEQTEARGTPQTTGGLV